MADKKVSQLTSLTTPSSDDLLLIIDTPNATPASKKITLKNLFGAVPANTVFKSRMTAQANATFVGSNTVHAANATFTNRLTANTLIVAANKLTITTAKANPSSNNASSESLKVGDIFWSNTYLYVVVNATTIKRIALSTF